MGSPEQADLSLIRISLYATAITALWLYLWFGGTQRMKTRRWQTWWQLGGYTVLWLLGWCGMTTEQLITIFSHISDVWRYPPVHSFSTVLYFEMEIAWYISQLICLLINRDTRDFYPMLVHHLITPIEIYYSYDCNYAAIGLVIMFLHDTSDLFLHLAKTFHNAKLRRSTDITFVLFASVFFVTRLCLLPLCPYAYFSTLGSHHSTCGDMLAGTCSLLVCLHCYWFYLIVMMIVRFMKAGEVEGDIREKEAEAKEKKLDEEMERRRVTALRSKAAKYGNGHTVTTDHSNGNGRHVIRRVENKTE